MRHTVPMAGPLRPALPALAAAFALVHAAYFAAGLRFDRSTLIEVMHFLDPQLLRERLLESVWHLHIQPPLYNLAVGLVLKLTPESALLFHALHLGLGFALYAGTYALQRRLGAGARIAFATSTLFMASPSFVLWEHILLYTMPCAALVMGAALALHAALARGTRRAWHAFYWSIFALCGIRTMFHLGYLALMCAAGALAAPSQRRRVLAAGALPLALTVAVYAKNYAVFGGFDVCSFAPKNLWIMTVGNMNGAKKAAWAADGRLSPLSLINRWESIEAYPPEYRAVPPRFAGAPALAAVHKSTGAVNYNHIGNIAVSGVYGRDARYALRHDPWAYAVAVMQSMYRYAIASHALPVSPHNKATMPWAMAAYDALYGKLPDAWAMAWRVPRLAGHAPYLSLALGMPLLLLYGLWRAAGRGPQLDRAQRFALLFACFNIAMVFGLGCALDFLETARYRFMTDGLYAVLLGMALQHLADRLRGAAA